MSRQIRVRAIKKEEPDIHLYVLALIGLARQLQEANQRPTQPPTAPAETDGEVHHERD